HEQHAGARAVVRDVMDAVANLGGRLGEVLRVQPLRNRLPRLRAVVGAEGAGGGDGDVDAIGVGGVEEDRVEAEAAGTRLPLRARAAVAQAGQLGPRLRAVGALEDRGVFDAGVDGVGVGERGFQVPDALEVPRVRRAVVPLVRAGRAVVGELVADGFPGLAAVARPLDHLTEPAARLRGIDPVRVRRGPLQVVQLPASKVGSRDVPVLAFAVSGQDKRAFFGPNEHTDTAHVTSSRRGTRYVPGTYLVPTWHVPGTYQAPLFDSRTGPRRIDISTRRTRRRGSSRATAPPARPTR